jgi:hypothetical protein
MTNQNLNTMAAFFENQYYFRHAGRVTVHWHSCQIPDKIVGHFDLGPVPYFLHLNNPAEQ